MVGFFRICIFAVLAASVTGCASDGEIDNPVQRRATWFSFISGQDIAAECEATGREQYRLTYIADRDIQVRIYDIDAEVTPDPQLRSRVLTVAASDWFPLPLFEDPTRPFRPRDRVANLSETELDAFRTRLVADGWSSEPPPIGREIASNSFTWLAAGCRNGTFSFQVWDYPDPEFLNLTFPEVLFISDPSDVPVAPYPDDGERRVYDAFTGRTGGNTPSDGRNLYNMVVGPRGMTLVN